MRLFFIIISVLTVSGLFSEADIVVLRSGEKKNEAGKAEKSIWITAYFISGSSLDPIHSFYETLKARALAGVDVVVLCEFGPGTEHSVKNETMNFAPTLLDAGVHVLFLQSRQVLHKKLIIIDGKKVFLGSSNLTAAGVMGNNEMNIFTDDPQFILDACADFQNLRQQAKTREAVNFQ